MALSENLQYIRTRSGMTQEQLAEQLDVSRQSVSKWESGTSFPEMETLLRICSLYDVDLDTLLRGSVEASRQEDTAGYNAEMNRYSAQVSLSVGAIIAAVALMIWMVALGISEMLAAAFLLLVITVSVVILVAGSIHHDQFHKKHPLIEDFYSQEEKDAFHRKLVWYIAGSIGAILFGVVLLLLFFTVFPETEPYESIAAGLFLLIIATAVATLIYAGMQDEKYKIWKYNRDNNPSPEVKKRLSLISTVCGCIMLTATALFLVLGFARDAWSTAWWVFPVGGILCGIVSTILDPYKGDDD